MTTAGTCSKSYLREEAVDKPIFVTTPIFYVNSRPHIGHAYSALLADAIARWFRDVEGRAVFFSTGTDEHGAKVQEAAEKAGVPVPEFCDEVSASFRTCFDQLNISYDDFVRTTEKRHAVTAR